MAIPILGAALKVVGNLFGIGKNFLDNRAKLKQAKSDQEYEIVKAETKAVVDRIQTNSQSDSEIDIITARNKKFSSKDEIVTYLFLTPVAIANIIPFVVAYQNDSWINLNQHFVESYKMLSLLPEWYPYIVGLIVIDVLGFRSFARKIIDKKFK